MSDITPGPATSPETKSPETKSRETKAPVYATPDEVLGWKSPEPLQFDYIHSDTGQLLRIEGICRAKDRKVIYAEIQRLKPNAASLAKTTGYEPTKDDIQNACWAAECVTAPKMTSLQWLMFGAEASLTEVAGECLVASRIYERRDPDAKEAEIPDGETAAELEMDQDPS